jgi:hypothetical protein
MQSNRHFLNGIVFLIHFRLLKHALSNEIAPSPIIFFLHEKISRRFFVKGVLFFGPGIQNKDLNKDLKMKIVKYLCHPGLDSF